MDDEQKAQETVTISMARFEQMQERIADLEDSYAELAVILQEYMDVERTKSGFFGLTADYEVAVHLDRIAQYIRSRYELKPFKTVSKIEFLFDGKRLAYGR